MQEGAIGELFHATPDAVLVFADGQLVASNANAEVLFGAAPAAVDHGRLRAEVPRGATLHRVVLGPGTVVDVIRRAVGGFDVLILRDVSRSVRQADGLRRIAAVSRGLIGAAPSVAEVAQVLVTEAKELTGAAYSALLLLKPGSLTETSHFAYDAPRHLFPAHMPRVVGLLAVPVQARAAARLDDIRGHPAGVGLPGVHPPIGPLVAVPVLTGTEVLGELAVANPPGSRVFDDVDEQLLEDLAAHVAVAVTWARQSEGQRERELQRQEVVDTARHDIRTPLGAGKGYAALLARKLDKMSPEQVATALEGLTSSFERIESFSERLLVDERHHLVGVEPVLADVNVAELLDQLARDVQAGSGRVVEVLLAEGTPSHLRGDPEMVREVLDNLVGNALKHTPDLTPVVLSARVEGDQVRFDVRDQGPGIPETEQASLFERWTRTDSSRSRQLPGFGLGLSIVKRLVTAHGGSLGVSSRSGEGATFWVTFPVPA
ncbi:MAG: integral rane sensor signal transduction histidine kinase [Frankiales bacterium]|nr:integral rane sensor signal transduction histidine kinase [Frankiales bacterium]